MKKKVLAIVLTIAMCSTCVTPVFASESADTAAESGSENEIFIDLSGDDYDSADTDSSDYETSGSDELFIIDPEYPVDETDFFFESDSDTENLVSESPSYEEISSTDAETYISDVSVFEETASEGIFPDEEASDLQGSDAPQITGGDQKEDQNPEVNETYKEDSGNKKNSVNEKDSGNEPEELSNEEGGIPVDAEHFPDGTFRSYVSSSCDPNGDEVLSADEISAVTSMDLEQGFQRNKIGSLEGIGYFTSLTSLNCTYNNLTALNVSGCTELSDLNCDHNNLTALDVSGCTKLSVLNCQRNNLTELDLSGCLTSLTELWCGVNDLTELDLTGCTALQRFSSAENKRLSSLKVSGLAKLEFLNCKDNNLNELDVSGCKDLKYFYCDDNPLSSLDLKDCTELENLACRYTNLSELDVSACTGLKHLDFYGDSASSVEAGNCSILLDTIKTAKRSVTRVGPRFEKEAFRFQKEYDGYWSLIICDTTVSFYENGNLIVRQGSGSGIAINDKNFPDDVFRSYIQYYYDTDDDGFLSDDEIREADEISLSGKGVSSLEGIKYFTSLEYLFCDNNTLSKLDVSACTELYDLDCSGNGLTELDVSACMKLDDLDCSGNRLKELDVSSHPDFERLYCSENELISLNVSGCTKLYNLYCENNNLSSLNISGCTDLSHLYCDNNDLSELDISECPCLIELKNNGYREEQDGVVCYSSSATQHTFQLDKNTELITEKTEITNLSLPVSSFTYTGSAIIPDVVVKAGDTVLRPDKDYSVSCSNNTNVGTASVTVSGRGKYAGMLKAAFTIRKAKPTLAFPASTVSKTYGNAPFTFALKTRKTDGAVSYSSSNTAVAVVDKSTGKVTIKGAGSAKITANAAVGKNYEAGSASCTLTVAKAANAITAKNITKTTASTAQKISIGATVKAATTLSYKSVNPSVKVSSKGVVTIPKNFVGSAVITITGKATVNYNAVTKKITVKVRPKSTSLTSLTNPSKSKLVAEWKRNSKVTGYQIQ
ncbi:MAG: hypothetical protein HUJ73_09245, partial [Eubacterium sp.]|nr:hypothetical protein [Eubacterium sp.]